jgi:hypothetical protein
VSLPHDCDEAVLEQRCAREALVHRVERADGDPELASDAGLVLDRHDLSTTPGARCNTLLGRFGLTWSW